MGDERVRVGMYDSEVWTQPTLPVQRASWRVASDTLRFKHHISLIAKSDSEWKGRKIESGEQALLVCTNHLFTF